MKKLSTFLLTLLLAIGLLAGCANGDDANKDPVQEPGTEEEAKKDQTDQAEEAFPITLTDDLGDQVTIEAAPEKIVSLMPSNTEIAFALGLEDEIVGVNDYDNYPEAVLEKEKIGGQEFNVEKVLSLEPDLVLAHGSSVKVAEEGLKQLRDAGITVLVVQSAESFDAVYETIELIGKATGKNAEAEQVISEMKADIKAVADKAADISEADRKTVLVEVSPSPSIFTTGKNTFMDEMLNIINANNAAADEEGWVELDEEALVSFNPDVIVALYGSYVEDVPGEVLNRQGWDDVTAYKDEAIFSVQEDIVSRSGPRLAEGVEELAKAVYPEIFAQ